LRREGRLDEICWYMPRWHVFLSLAPDTMLVPVSAELVELGLYQRRKDPIE
jgi:hypothetical protein